MSPDVSVIIPTKSRWSLLSTAALPSALAQEGVDLEVIVVDDGSVDETYKRLEALADPRVRVVRHDRSRGVAAARNAGIAVARAPWTAFLDDDDLWSPRKLAVQVAALEHTGAAFAYCSVVVLAEDGTPTELLRAPPAPDLVELLRRRSAIPAGSSTVVAGTALLRRVGGYDDRLTYLEDWDLWIRLLMHEQAVACEEVLVAYVRHPLRMLGGAASVAVLAQLRDKHGSARFEPDMRSLLGWIAAEHRRGGHRRDAVSIYARTAWKHRDAAPLVHAAATIVDWRGRGLRRLLRPQQAPPAHVVAAPDWLRGR
jgi:glycosyltransferase involved in cell wall biosynthesis